MELISVDEVANTLGFSSQYIRTLLRKGKLPGEKIGKQWLVDESAFETRLEVNEPKIEYSVSDRRNTSGKLSDVKALSFFSGAMGMDLGLEKAGISILLASEIDKASRNTIVKNNPNIGLIGDIRDYSVNDILDYAGLSHDDDIDLIVGGPPCQAFSTAGKRKAFEDERGNVFLTFINIITSIKPKYAVIENVRGLLSAPLKHRPHSQRGEGYPPLSIEEKRGGALNHIIGLLENAGYGVSFNLYNAANFGSPQKRERLIIICCRNGEKPPYLIQTHSHNAENGFKKWKTFREAVKGIENVEMTYVPFPEKRLKYYRMLKPGENWRALPEELQKEALGKSYFAQGGRTGFFRRLSWDEPSPTLVTHPAMPATDLAHPTENRPLSVEEYKRIQEFPDSWKIMGNKMDQYRQIGNAVPISLGNAVGVLIKKLLNGEKIEYITNKKFSRYTNTDEISFKEQIEKEDSKQLIMLF